MKRSATICLLVATSVLAVFLILGGTIISRTALGDHEAYMALLERRDAEFRESFLSDKNTEWQRYAAELTSRKEEIENLSSIIVSLGRSLVGFGIAILSCQLLILRSLSSSNRSSQEELRPPSNALWQET